METRIQELEKTKRMAEAMMAGIMDLIRLQGPSEEYLEELVFYSMQAKHAERQLINLTK